MLTPLRVLAAAAMVLTAGTARAGIIFSNDFSANANGFAVTTTIVTAPNGEKFLGPLTQGAFTALTLNTTGYSSITLNFDLYGILSLDGSNPGPTGQDFFQLTVAGGPVLLNESFSNFVNYPPNPGSTFQSYGPNPSDPGRTGSDAALYGHLGYFWANPEGGDSTYHLSYTFAPTGNFTTILFTGLSNQGPADEYFGIDNVVVNAPEPATWTMLIIGLGAARGAIRRRRA